MYCLIILFKYYIIFYIYYIIKYIIFFIFYFYCINDIEKTGWWLPGNDFENLHRMRLFYIYYHKF